MSLRQITIGSASMSLVSIIRMFAQFFMVPIMARFLSPADYGIVAIAMPFVLFAMMFSDAGISVSLVKTTSKNIREWSTSFWLTIVLGSVLAIIICLIGLGISIVLSEPKLFSIISCLSLIIVLQSIATVPGAALQQEYKFTTVAIIDIFSTLLSLYSAYLAASNNLGAWALVIQQLIYYLSKLTFTVLCSSFRPNFVFQISTIKEHLIFGRDLLGNNFVGFLKQSIGNMIVGRVLGTSQVGIYSMASQFSDLPNRLVSGPLQLILYMRISHLKENLELVSRLFLFITRVVSILVIPLIGMMGVAHQPIFTLLLSEKWAAAGHVFFLLAPAAAIQTVSALRNTIAMAYNRTDILLKQSIEVTIISLVLMAIFVTYGLEAIVISVVIFSILYTPRALIQILPLVGISLREYVRTITIPFICTAICILLYLFSTLYAGHSDAIEFGIAIMLGCLSLIFSVFLQWRILKIDMLYLRENVSKAS